MGERLLVSGWGSTTERGKLSPKLQSVYVSVLEDIICYDYFMRLGWRLPIPDFCAGEHRFLPFFFCIFIQGIKFQKNKNKRKSTLSFSIPSYKK